MIGHCPTRRLSRLCALLAVLILLGGCHMHSSSRTTSAITNYYSYDFTTARQTLRADAELRRDENFLLNNLRLGMAALADGDADEAERAFARVFNLLSTAGLNRDRTTAAILIHEGVRIWKGEPFEQALAYYWIAALYATLGDWENVRAAASNSIFRLTDFGGDQDARSLARTAAEQPGYLEDGYTAVDTNFALGLLVQAIGSRLSGASGADAQLDAALKINPKLRPLIDTLRAGDFDTLLLVDFGRGPAKIAHGPDQALVKFVPRRDRKRPLEVRVDGTLRVAADPVCDVDQMAVDHRWNNLEDVRRAKSTIGDLLVSGGSAVAFHGSRNDSVIEQIIGLGMIAAGLLTKESARADTRYLEYAPQVIYLVPLKLERTRELRIAVENDTASTFVLPDFLPGTSKSPRAVYVRLHANDRVPCDWMTATTLVYGNDFAGIAPGDQPWIVGGTDLSTPSRRNWENYRRGGRLSEVTLRELRNLYRAEEILIGSGMENRPGVARNPSFRHVLEGGRGLFTPTPYSMGYKRLMYTPRPAYVPRSELVGNVARENGVQQVTSLQESQP